METIGVIAYALVGLVFARVVAGSLAWEGTAGDRAEGLDWAGGWIFGVLIGAVWPLYLVFRVLTGVPLGPLAGGAEAKALYRRHEEELRERERRLEQLEREAGLS